MNSNFHDLPLDDKLSAWLDDELTKEQRAEIDAWLRDTPTTPHACGCGRPTATCCARASAPRSTSRCPRGSSRSCGARRRPRSRGWQRIAAGWRVRRSARARRGAMWRWQRAERRPADPPARAGSSARCSRTASTRRGAPPGRGGGGRQDADESRAQEEHLSRWLTKRLGMPVKLFDLRAQGYELVGGRLLPDTAAPSAQLMYQRIGEPTRRASPCTCASPTARRRRPSATTRRTSSACSIGSKADRLCAGRSLPKEQLLALAEAIYKQGTQN
jgi:anti-sigma factor RsiW